MLVYLNINLHSGINAVDPSSVSAEISKII